MGWQRKVVGDYVTEHIILPRITLILGVSSWGKIYYSLMQANSNEDTIRLYFYRLVEQLDQADPKWRKDTIFQLDGA